MSKRKDERADAAREPAAEGLSRRGFLKGAGLTVAAVSMTGPQAAGKSPAGLEEVQILGPEPVEFSLKINGVMRKVKASPMTTLLDLLRNDLDMTGAKRVCDRSSCGACTVIVDGKTANACSQLAIDLEGREIRTIEGLVGEDGVLTPIQSAFVECDAMQCGFCTPGMVMACTSMLEKNPKPSRAEAAEGIAGNICRCGTYENIFEAVQLAASGKVGVRKK